MLLWWLTQKVILLTGNFLFCSERGLENEATDAVAWTQECWPHHLTPHWPPTQPPPYLRTVGACEGAVPAEP